MKKYICSRFSSFNAKEIEILERLLTDETTISTYHHNPDFNGMLLEISSVIKMRKEHTEKTGENFEKVNILA